MSSVFFLFIQGRLFSLPAFFIVFLGEGRTFLAWFYSSFLAFLPHDVDSTLPGYDFDDLVRIFLSTLLACLALAETCCS